LLLRIIVVCDLSLDVIFLLLLKVQILLFLLGELVDAVGDVLEGVFEVLEHLFLGVLVHLLLLELELVQFQLRERLRGRVRVLLLLEDLPHPKLLVKPLDLVPLRIQHVQLPSIHFSHNIVHDVELEAVESGAHGELLLEVV